MAERRRDRLHTRQEDREFFRANRRLKAFNAEKRAPTLFQWEVHDETQIKNVEQKKKNTTVITL